jgi:hypothetical protein
MHLLNVFRANLLIVKRTQALWLALAAPLFIVAFRVLLFIFGRDPAISQDPWNHFLSGNYNFWFGIFIVLTMPVNVALLIDLDRSSGSWKYLFALPVSRAWIYLSKLGVALLLVSLSGLTLLVSSLIVGYVLGLVRPDLGFTKAAPNVSAYFVMVICATVGASFIISIHTWLSVRSKSFIVPIALGIAAAVMNIIGFSKVEYQKFSPWMYGMDITRVLSLLPSNEPYRGWSLPVILAISLAGAVLVTLWGINELNRRDIL